MVSVSGTVRRLFFFRARVVCVAGYSLVVRSRKDPGKPWLIFILMIIQGFHRTTAMLIRGE